MSSISARNNTYIFILIFLMFFGLVTGGCNKSPYYRLAYLHVISDVRNPFFDYKKATAYFEKFIETYPNSRYIIACKNWLNLLRSVTPATVDPVIIRVKENADPAVLNRLKAEIKSLQQENTRLKQTLDELQRAIER